MKAEDFSNLDPKNLGNWPIPVKALIIIILCLLALVAGYWFDTQHQITYLAEAQAKESNIKTDFEKKQWQAATLPKLKEQLKKIESTLDELLKKLPGEVQVDELIRDISQTILASGLKQELFKPIYKDQISEKGLYIKLPVKIIARGDYHKFGKFISDVAAMNRIVTVHNVSIEMSKNKKDKYPLILEMIAQIYRYMDPSEAKAAENKGKKPKTPKTPPKKSGHH
jgi:type IV pilus assembly protein PilO